MKIDRFLLPFLLLCFFAFVTYSLAANTDDQQKSSQKKSVVVHCFDGDTVKLMDRSVVRIAGIDCPELAHESTREQFFARDAQKILEEAVKGQKVTLVFVGTQTKDRYGRILADLVLEDGQSVAALMIEKGAAFAYPFKNLYPEFQETLLEKQKEAIGKRQGMWEELLTSSIATQNYVGNQESMRFFPDDCPKANTIKPRNRVYFGTVMDAFLAGFAPSRVCPFWPNVRE